jgi:hypothetical protein
MKPLFRRSEAAAPLSLRAFDNPAADHRRARVTIALLTIAGCVCASSAKAQFSLTWNFDATTPSSALPSGMSQAPEITQHNNNGTTTLLTSTSASSGYAGASGGNNAGAAARIGALDFGTSGSVYFQTVLTPDTNYQLTLSSISFGSRSTSTGPQYFTVTASYDGITNQTIATGSLLNNAVWGMQTPALTSITATAMSPITLRIFGHDGSGSAVTGQANWRIDDLTIGGSLTAIPEPSTYGAITGALALVGTLLYRRRSRRSGSPE